MNTSRGARSVARIFAALTAAAVLTSAFAGPAAAEDPAPTPTSTAPSTVPSPSEAPPSSEVPPPSSTQPESKPAAAQPQDDPVPQPDLDVSFDIADSYPTNADVHFTIKIHNPRSVPAEGLQVAQWFDKPDDLVVPFIDGWGPLSGKPGVTLQPGETFTQAVVGQLQDISQDHANLRGFVYDKDGHGVAPGFDIPIKLEKTPGHATGVVYGDANGNGTFDAGEELTGITLTLRYSSLTYQATSGKGGHFDFGEIPAAKYHFGGDVLGGWLFPFQNIEVGADTELLVRGAPPLDGKLTASMAFTQDSYQVGDLAHVAVKLTNSGSVPLTGIVAECDRFGASYALKGTGPGWGDLAGDGVRIAPGETRTIDVTEQVPAGALDRGIVTVSCDFGYRGVDLDNHALAADEASVPGGKATIVGDVAVYGEQGGVKQGVAGTKVVLVSDGHCPVTAERTTDANGHFEFHDVAPGPDYQLYLLPPKGWKIKYENPAVIYVRGPAERPVQVRIDAEEGDAPLPTVPVNPADCTAGAPTTTTGPGGGTGGGQSGPSGLASTGVDALGLGALALLALALGGGLVFGARRRRSA
ncbi:hypothetical protein SAMN04489727_1100 [Amycolatopsis tolypomycina]|uniref:Gram-positive cocci surface proteins LPxTG domain-containing protein n=1 Tax=Amycolatopsis tolypomycina TaxID=208445 RepID=A0A1H4ILP5_9PSEU|nr:hypothetical protein [Amycolatopsis tolypomycina]SEB34960.1 hypothetical protein SAMN04489727_1100 [Amycolatopsis tolypomycina]